MTALVLLVLAAQVDLDGRLEDEPLPAEITVVSSYELDEVERAWRALFTEAIQHLDLQSLQAPWDVPLPLMVKVEIQRDDPRDAATAGTDVIRVNLHAWERHHAARRTADPAGTLSVITRVLSHELTHLLSDNQWASTWTARSPIDRALGEMFHEGFGNLRSLGPSWDDPAIRAAALARLEPVLVQRLEALALVADATSEAALMTGLADGPLPDRWGALPVALWLRGEAEADPGALRALAEQGPLGVLGVLERNLAPSDFARITAALTPEAAEAPPDDPAALPAQPEAPPEPQGEPPPTPRSAPEDQRDLGYYALWYGPEWGLDVLQLGLLLGNVYDAIPANGPSIGPTFDAEDPANLFDPRLDDIIGRPFVQEQISEGAAATGIIVAIAAVGAADFGKFQDLHRTHNFVLGATTAIATTATVTWGLKLGVGRLRPDFRERYVRAACSGAVENKLQLDCAAVDDGFVLGAAELEKGRRSFPSGHASLSFAAATYLGLHVGSTWVWGDSIPESGPWRTASQVGGAIAGGALVATAGYVAASRVTDGRHHPDDVVLGALLGSSFGAASYLLHFDLDGSAKSRGLSVSPLPLDGPGLALRGEW